MIGQCCADLRASQRFPRRLSKVTASLLPAAALVFLPKCPLCVAAWLTIATGVSFSAASATWLRWSIALLCVTTLVAIVWRCANEGRQSIKKKAASPEARRMKAIASV